MHKDAPTAHMASLAAHKQGKFWDYHDKLFANTRKLKLENLRQYAQELGLDMKRFETDLVDLRNKSVIPEGYRHPGLLRQRPLPFGGKTVRSVREGDQRRARSTEPSGAG
jgi:hypothetical protein